MLFVIASVNSFGYQSRLLFEKLEGYNIDIYLPNGYMEDQQYKTIYFNDGQMVFGAGGLNLKASLDSLISAKVIAPIIVVGVHADHNRTEKYVPYNDPNLFRNSRPENSLANQYSIFLADKLVPFINAKLATSESSSDRAMFGLSFGGLQATWMVLNHPKLFSFSCGLSPSFWVADYQIAKEATKRESGQRFWFDIGTAEWNYYVPMIGVLQQTGGKYGEDIFYSEVPNGEHNAFWWRKRVIYPVMLFAGSIHPKVKSMKVEIEVIRSQSRSGVYYQRLNPIITCEGGVGYSLATEATYTLLNPEAGLVKEDGRFEFSGTDNLKIRVDYQGLNKQVTVKYSEVERDKK